MSEAARSQAAMYVRAFLSPIAADELIARLPADLEGTDLVREARAIVHERVDVPADEDLAVLHEDLGFGIWRIATVLDLPRHRVAQALVRAGHDVDLPPSTPAPTPAPTSAPTSAPETTEANEATREEDTEDAEPTPRPLAPLRRGTGTLRPAPEELLPIPDEGATPDPVELVVERRQEVDERHAAERRSILAAAGGGAVILLLLVVMVLVATRGGWGDDCTDDASVAITRARFLGLSEELGGALPAGARLQVEISFEPRASDPIDLAVQLTRDGSEVLKTLVSLPRQPGSTLILDLPPEGAGAGTSYTATVSDDGCALASVTAAVAS